MGDAMELSDGQYQCMNCGVISQSRDVAIIHAATCKYDDE